MSSVFLICVGLLLVSIDRLHVCAQDNMVSDAINSYGINYYKESINPNQNIIVSGYGRAIVKTMLLAGAGGDTDTTLRSELGYDTTGLSDAQIENAFNQILTTQRNHNPGYELDVATSLWIQTGFNVLPSYKSTLAQSFLAEEQNIDFGRSTSTAAIRNWVTRVTKRRTNNNLFRGFANNQEKVVLMNALYFSARMKVQFDRRQLRRRPFTEYNGSTQRSLRGLMVGTTNMYNYTYSQDLDADVLELPYNGNEVNMFIVLPRSVTGLPDLEQGLTLAQLKAAEAQLTLKKVAVTMPFIADYNQVGTLSYSALDQLDNIDDDLSGIDGQQDLYESEDDQSEIFRYGLDTIYRAGNSLRGQPDVTFNANKPFLFYFCHRPTAIVLFMGRLIRPLGNGII